MTKGKPMQTTVAGAIKFEGIGVHSGHRTVATVKPAPVHTGIRFVRSDITDRNNIIPARYDHVVDARLCTVIANEAGVSLSTIEHLVAALAGVGVLNAVVEIDGPETPIMDGSAAPFVRGLLDIGVVEQGEAVKAWKIVKPVEVASNGRKARLEPCRHFEMSFEIDFDATAIGKQQKSMRLVNGAFIDHLSRARTFGMLSDVKKLRAAGLARGGSLENAIVVDGAKVLNRDGLRYSDEFVRHKMLDAVGDLALAGAPVIGRYRGVCAGHAITNLLLRKLFDTPGAAKPMTIAHGTPTLLGVMSAARAAA
jgi:UDP-3-O-[3-hydroxymyristoyl] N-acetylglucosamine deacetylase